MEGSGRLGGKHVRNLRCVGLGVCCHGEAPPTCSTVVPTQVGQVHGLVVCKLRRVDIVSSLQPPLRPWLYLCSPSCLIGNTLPFPCQPAHVNHVTILYSSLNPNELNFTKVLTCVKNDQEADMAVGTPGAPQADETLGAHSTARQKYQNQTLLRVPEELVTVAKHRQT